MAQTSRKFKEVKERPYLRKKSHSLYLISIRTINTAALCIKPLFLVITSYITLPVGLVVDAEGYGSAISVSVLENHSYINSPRPLGAQLRKYYAHARDNRGGKYHAHELRGYTAVSGAMREL